MREREQGALPVVGGSSLLVIFAILCLTTFAMLTLSTVAADGQLSDRQAEAVAAYYAADTEAETVLARLRAGEIPDGVTVDGTTYRYACRVSDVQELRVEVRIEDASRYTVLKWQMVSTADWTPDDTLQVWDGE